MHNDSMEGAVLGGRYQLQERVGVGGMSVVYRAMDTQTDRIVAIKTLKEEYCSDAEFVYRFQNEVKATAGLQHPNIVEIYDQGEEDGMPFIVMEFIEGITLKDYIVALQTVKWRDALSVTAQVLSAVSCAHGHKVIHRDIKPQNIMITDAGQIKLTDFGIARVVSSSTKQAKPDSAGSVHYLSPEQARGGFVDERSDIYSIGIMLYEMVTGVVPFDGESHVSIALKHIDGHIVPPHTVDPEIPYGVSDLIMMATNKNPVQRFQSAEEMYDRMQKVLEEPGYSFLNMVASHGNEDGTSEETDINNLAGSGLHTEDSLQEQASYKTDRAEIIRSVTVAAIAYLLAIIVGVVGIVFIVSRYQNLKQNMTAFSNVQFEVADYKGMQADAVVSSLSEKGIQVQKVPVESEEYPIGYVVDQNVKAGTVLEDRTVLELQVSSLSGSFVLEDYAGSDYRDVGARLNALGIQVTYSPVASGKYQEQKVVRTSPDAGSIIVSGDAVVVYYSTGTIAEIVTIPDLKGLTLEQAQQKLELAGLRVGLIYPQPGSDISDLIAAIPEGSNLYQNGTTTLVEPSGSANGSPSATPGTQETPHASQIQPASPTGTTEAASPTGTTGAASPTGTASPTESQSPTQPATPTPTVPPTKEPVLASETVVDQYPAKGTKVYKYETVNLYFCDAKYLETQKEVTFALPEGIQSETCDVRIEAAIVGSSAIATILYNETGVKRDEFPLTYQVTFPYSGAPVRVTIYIDGQIYQEIVLYE